MSHQRSRGGDVIFKEDLDNTYNYILSSKICQGLELEIIHKSNVKLFFLVTCRDWSRSTPLSRPFSLAFP